MLACMAAEAKAEAVAKTESRAGSPDVSRPASPISQTSAEEDEAREALGGFIRQAHRQGWRCVRVVHGKGLGSPGKTPVLKNKVLRWLVQKNEVLAFVQATPSEGGAGALRVLLAPGSGPSHLTLR